MPSKAYENSETLAELFIKTFLPLHYFFPKKQAIKSSMKPSFTQHNFEKAKTKMFLWNPMLVFSKKIGSSVQGFSWCHFYQCNFFEKAFTKNILTNNFRKQNILSQRVPLMNFWHLDPNFTREKVIIPIFVGKSLNFSKANAWRFSCSLLINQCFMM